MLRTILELSSGPMSDTEFAEVMELATSDIKINRVSFGKRTNIHDAVDIAAGCLVVLQRGAVA